MYVLVEIDRPTTKPLHPEKVVVEQAGLKLVDESVTRRYVGATGPGPVQIFDVCRLIFFWGDPKKSDLQLWDCAAQKVLYVKIHLLRFSPKF